MVVLLLLAAVIVAAYFYLKRRQQHVHLNDAGAVEHGHAHNPDDASDHGHDLGATTDTGRRD